MVEKGALQITLGYRLLKSVSEVCIALSKHEGARPGGGGREEREKLPESRSRACETGDFFVVIFHSTSIRWKGGEGGQDPYREKDEDQI